MQVLESYRWQRLERQRKHISITIGIEVDQGLVALADTQIALGSERISKPKLAARYHDDDSLFTMTRCSR
ncbi:MAG: hypothetical protein RIK87_18750 [Fuerstiella sp.]